MSGLVKQSAALHPQSLVILYVQRKSPVPSLFFNKKPFYPTVSCFTLQNYSLYSSLRASAHSFRWVNYTLGAVEGVVLQGEKIRGRMTVMY